MTQCISRVQFHYVLCCVCRMVFWFWICYPFINKHMAITHRGCSWITDDACKCFKVSVVYLFLGHESCNLCCDVWQDTLLSLSLLHPVVYLMVTCNRGFAQQPCCMAGTMKIFCIRKNLFFPIGKRMFSSCHATWLPCKTSILSYSSLYMYMYMYARVRLAARSWCMLLHVHVDGI